MIIFIFFKRKKLYVFEFFDKEAGVKAKNCIKLNFGDL